MPGAVEQVLDNLIDNAVTAATDPSGGGQVIVSVGRDDEGTWLRVSDDGPGLDDDGKHRATDRFWRGDTSGVGSGLGLPIVVELVAAGGGTVELTDAAEGGLAVSVRFERGLTCGSAGHTTRSVRRAACRKSLSVLSNVRSRRTHSAAMRASTVASWPPRVGTS